MACSSSMSLIILWSSASRRPTSAAISVNAPHCLQCRLAASSACRVFISSVSPALTAATPTRRRSGTPSLAGERAVRFEFAVALTGAGLVCARRPAALAAHHGAPEPHAALSWSLAVERQHARAGTGIARRPATTAQMFACCESTAAPPPSRDHGRDFGGVAGGPIDPRRPVARNRHASATCWKTESACPQCGRPLPTSARS